MYGQAPIHSKVTYEWDEKLLSLVSNQRLGRSWSLNKQPTSPLKIEGTERAEKRIKRLPGFIFGMMTALANSAFCLCPLQATGLSWSFPANINVSSCRVTTLQ